MTISHTHSILNLQFFVQGSGPSQLQGAVDFHKLESIGNRLKALEQWISDSDRGMYLILSTLTDPQIRKLSTLQAGKSHGMDHSDGAAVAYLRTPPLSWEPTCQS